MNNTTKKRKCAIFGCGQIGKAAFYKLRNYYNIVCWLDNNSTLWNGMLFDLPILSPGTVAELYMQEEMDIFVAILNGTEVVQWLRSRNIPNVYEWKNGFFYTIDGLFPLEFAVPPYIKPNNVDESNENILDILFISDSAGIRDHKMASIIKKAGHRVFHAYISRSPEIAYPEYKDLYEQIYPIMSLKSLEDFVSNSDFDVIHASSQPDFVAALLSGGDKPIILDCHDLRSSNQQMTPDQLMMEYLAHTGADGVIYPTESLREEALRKYARPLGSTLVMENYISADLIPTYRCEKKSKADGHIHCVYEGNLVMDKEKNYKYFKKIWSKILDAGIHIHFYSANKNEAMELSGISDKIHYEGNVSSHVLAYELSQYDVGLAIYNINAQNVSYLEKSSPNKVYEYLNAGIPIAVNGIESISNFVVSNGFGLKIDMSGDLVKQFMEVASIRIPDDILVKRGYVFENLAQNLIDMYMHSIKNAGER